MANQVEGLNGTRSTYVYENIEIVEIDGVRMVRRLKDKKIIGLNSPKKEPQEGYYQRQFNKSQPLLSFSFNEFHSCFKSDTYI